MLDPACGSGNFLYVTLEHLKRLEGEVLDTLEALGQRQMLMELAGVSVDPHQLLGLELNPRAAAIAETVLWIGYLQWHFRTRGDIRPPEPVIRDFRNIECRDAVLDYDRVEWVTDEPGRPVTRWDGRTMKPHPVTGEPVPDETARVPLERYVNPRPAEWPEADFVVGNPPFIGDSACARRSATATSKPCARPGRRGARVRGLRHVLVAQGRRADSRPEVLARFGFITTNSISPDLQPPSHRSAALRRPSPIHLAYAIPTTPGSTPRTVPACASR